MVTIFCLGVNVRCAVEVDGGVQVGSGLQTVVGNRVVLVEATRGIQNLVTQLTGELHREVDVLVAEGVAPSEDDLRGTTT